MTIVEFLTARLDEDEAYATNAAEEFGPDWIEIWSGQIDLSANLPDRQPPEGRHWDAHVQTNDAGVSRHMVRHDPARVLREVAAKRKLVAEYQFAAARDPYTGRDPGNIEHVAAITTEIVGREVLLRVLWVLALPYADHPDHDPTWNVNAT